MTTSTLPYEEISQRTMAAGRMSALGCALLLPLCAWIAWPVVELGVNDEWSYAKTVQVLVQTGHIVYNGWATAMVGWMFYLGALFVKLFGFSFTTVRLSMLPVSMATVFLTHRTMARCGINNWNATLGTLTLMLSPLYLPLAISFMTDVPGVFCVVLCLYACVRALQTTDKAALAWLCFAAFSNALSGTVRQIAWLGVLVMVPSTIWLLRRRPRFVTLGSAAYLISVAFIFGAMRWFHHQLYSVPESLVQGAVNSGSLGNVVLLFVGSVLDIGFLLLPVLLFFIPGVSLRSRTTARVFLATAVVFAVYAAVQAHELKNWLVPYTGNYVTIFGILSDSPVHGPLPIVLHGGLRMLLTVLLALGIASLIAIGVSSARDRFNGEQRQEISWHSLAVLLVPFIVAYFTLLVPRAIASVLFDRYLLAPLFFAAIPILRLYQERVERRIPAIALVPIGLYAVFAVAGTHDSFVRFRAYLEAINELRTAGVPAAEIDGGLSFDGWTQIERVGYVNDPRIPVRPGEGFRPSVKDTFGSCPLFWVDSFSADYRYGIGAFADSCLGSGGLPPVTYRTWLSPYVNKLYIVRVGQPDRSKPQQR